MPSFESKQFHFLYPRPTCWCSVRKFAKIVRIVPRIEEQALLTTTIYVNPFEILDHRPPFTCLNIHKFSSKLKYALRHAYSKFWIHHCMISGLTLLLKRRRGKASLFSSVDNFDTLQQASRQIVFEWKHAAGKKRAHSGKNIAWNGFDSCKELFHPTVLFAEGLRRWSLRTFMSVNDDK